MKEEFYEYLTEHMTPFDSIQTVNHSAANACYVLIHDIQIVVSYEQQLFSGSRAQV